ncbi:MULTISPECIES: hypothetical protein [Hydrocarboniphaga]|jgi:hypothetical protein|uniref:Uncharacterized protein n=1 Tax=Hydrocarboniphaga effusa AP103 TaxID=1172194 RepID=I8HYV6_9GAMM|nr:MULTISPECIES: hypothetical protein [Hydrocarboniphaga]EIT68686.1 hypothetical protein WQQ_38810 [Hydrocarboniphaga effusa AP103]MDZ4076797.1 hypothetical protein [Hydrocarboniphaga sp.]
MSRSSETVVLMLLGGAVLGSLALAERGQRSRLPPERQLPHLRNQYANLDDCNCAYSSAQCSYESQLGRWVGPWYLRDPDERSRAPYDAGPGQRCGSTHGSSAAGRYRGPVETEQSTRSTRSGFGSHSGGHMG